MEVADACSHTLCTRAPSEHSRHARLHPTGTTTMHVWSATSCASSSVWTGVCKLLCPQSLLRRPMLQVPPSSGQARRLPQLLQASVSSREAPPWHPNASKALLLKHCRRHENTHAFESYRRHCAQHRKCDLNTTSDYSRCLVCGFLKRASVQLLSQHAHLASHLEHARMCTRVANTCWARLNCKVTCYCVLQLPTHDSPSLQRHRQFKPISTHNLKPPTVSPLTTTSCKL